MQCDAKKLDGHDGGFSCSVLGDTVGANWLWDKSPYKEKIQCPPVCDANLAYKRGLFGKKTVFSCWVMGSFKVIANAEQLEAKVLGCSA